MKRKYQKKIVCSRTGRVLCGRCRVNPVSESRVRKGDYLCSPCLSKRNPTSEESRQKNRIADRERMAKYRDTILDHYGRSCCYCGRTDELCIDHKNGDGKAHRAQFNGVRRGVLKDIIRRNFPDSFQILCKTCNVAKGAMNDDQFRDWISKVTEYMKRRSGAQRG